MTIDTVTVDSSTDSRLPRGYDEALTRDQLDDMGSLSLFGCRLFLLIVPLALLGAVAQEVDIPRVLYAVPAFGAAVVAPRKVLLRIQVSISLFLLLGWTIMSYTWSIDPTNTLHQVREELVPIIGLVLVAGMLPVDETIKWFVRGMKLALAVSLLALAVEPGATDDAWQAWFASKNNFGRTAALALLTLLVWDRTVWSRLFWMFVALVFVVGSSSATALAASMAIVGLAFWVRRYQTVGQRWSGSFALASIAAGLTVMAGAFLSAAWVVSALGRDLTFTGRTKIWTAALDAIERRPTLGHGYGSVLFNGLTQESRQVWRDVGFDAANAHSGLLELATGIGLPGMFLFFLFYLSTMTAALRLLRTSYVATWAFVFLLVQLVVGVVEPVFMNDWLGPLVLCWVLLSKVALDQRRGRESWRTKSDGYGHTDQLNLDIKLDA